MTETLKLYGLKPSTSSQLMERANQLQTTAAAALDRYYQIVEQIEQLEAEGITNASAWYRDDKYLYLVHPTQPDGSRQREYIGANAAKQAAALARLQRYAWHQTLTRQANQLGQNIESFTYSLDRLISLLEK